MLDCSISENLVENQCPHNHNAQLRIHFYISESSYIISRKARRYYVNYLSLHCGLLVAQWILLVGINHRYILGPHAEEHLPLLLMLCEE